MRPLLPLLPVLLGASLAAADGAPRDPWLQPFASDSIWNMPIGANAVYVHARIAAAAHHGIDTERHFRLKAADPVREVYPPSSWSKRWPGDQSFPYRTGPQWRMPVPNDLIIADAAPPSTPNNCFSFLMPDGREIRQLGPTCRAVSGAQIVGWPNAPVDLYGTGIPGSHGGSGLSALGGSLRLGELVGSAPITHALKINVWAKSMYWDGNAKKGYRWPADRDDSYASATTYTGTVPAMRMGSLLALKPGVTPTSLGVTTEPGKKLLAAFRDYGAYVADDTAWDAIDLCCEAGVASEVETATGLSLTGQSGALVADLRRIVAALHVVDNNTASAIGGGGTPRVEMAPRLADPAIPVPGPVQAKTSGGGVLLTWGDPSSTETGFEIRRRLAGGTWTVIQQTGANTTSLSDSPADGTWDYQVRTLVGANASAWSAAAGVLLAAAPPPQVWRISFQPAGAPLTSGWLRDSGKPFGSRFGQTYGWTQDLSASKFTRDRNASGSPDQQHDTHLWTGSTTRTWEFALPNGNYEVHLVMGDPLDKYMPDRFRAMMEGTLIMDDTATTSTNWISKTAAVSVTDGRLTLVAVGGSDLNNKLCFIEIRTLPTFNG